MEDLSQVVAALRDECRDVGGRITTYHALGERTLTLGSSVVFAVAGLALTNGFRFVLILLPFPLFAIATYVAYVNTEVMSLGGYKAQLEAKLNGLLGTRVAIWESELARARHRDLSTIAVRALFTICLVATAIVSIREALLSAIPGHWGYDMSGWILAGAIGLIAIGAIAWLVAVVGQNRSHTRIAAASRRLLLDTSVVRRSA